MKTYTVFFAFAIAFSAIFALLTYSSAYAAEVSNIPLALLSSPAGPSASIQLVRGRGGAGSGGGHKFSGGHFGRHTGLRFYGGWSSGVYDWPYHWQSSCLDLTWNTLSQKWVCNDP